MLFPVVSFMCPYCIRVHAPQGDCEAGSDIVCCGERGHVVPVVHLETIVEESEQ